MHRLLIAIAGLGLAALPAAAQTQVPEYDADKFCGELANGSAVDRNFCIGEEQAAYDQLKLDWSRYDAAQAAYCDGLVRTFTPSYADLKYCLDTEAQAAAAPSSFRP